jgi:competence protein ComEA
VAATPADDDVGSDVAGHASRSQLAPFVTDTVVPWLRFVGPGRLLGALGVALVLAGIGWWLLRAPTPSTESRLPLAGRTTAAQHAVGTSASSPPLPSTTVAVVVIHVTGAVRTPGVYELSAGQRVADAIDAAGGALADAEPDALNLAAPVADGDRIAVPTASEVEAGAPAAAAGHSAAAPGDAIAAAAPLDINTATIAELETLPQVGPSTAAAIVEFREERGPFATVDDLEAVPGIGPAKLEAIRELVRT